MKKILLLTFLLLSGICALSSDGNKVKTFERYNCSLALPGSTWQWVDETDTSGFVAAAVSRENMVITLFVAKTPPGLTLDQKFINGFEEAFLKTSNTKKRSGKMIEFMGQPCYQMNVMFQDRTAVVFLFINGGFLYNLQVLGHQSPVEGSKDFKRILGSFQFLKKIPPSQKKPFGDSAFSEAMGQIAGSFLLAACFVYAFKKWFGKKKLQSALKSPSPDE